MLNALGWPARRLHDALALRADAAWRAQNRCRTAHGAPGSAAQLCRAPDKTPPGSENRRVVLSGDLDQLPSRLGIQRQDTARQADRGLSAWESDRSRPVRPAEQPTSGTVSSRERPLMPLVNCTVIARRSSAFQAGRILNWGESCGCYALSPVAAACRWLLLLLLSPLLSSLSGSGCLAVARCARGAMSILAPVL
jgi:hypothetical protein